MDQKQTELIRRIKEAFADVVLGEGASLNMTEYYDSGCTEPKYLERATNDERHDWQAISDATLEQFTVTFSFTDLEGYRFYLPAYMIWTIKNHESSDSIISSHTIYSIDPTHYLFKDHPISKFFTNDQITCITDFLRFCIQHDETCDGEYANDNLKKIEAEIAGHIRRPAPDKHWRKAPPDAGGG